MPVREIFRRFWPYARPYRRWLALSLVLIALVPLVDTAMIWMFKVVVDQVLVPQDFGPFIWIAGAYVGLTLIAGVLGFSMTSWPTGSGSGSCSISARGSSPTSRGSRSTSSTGAASAI